MITDTISDYELLIVERRKEYMKFVKVPTLIIIAAFIALDLNAQYSIMNDTLRIDEVVISGKQISSEQPGFRFFNIDSLSGRSTHLFSISDVLSENSPLFIKNYGSGGTATASFRGTSAGHTQVTWNGISINDPMLGQADFSLLPSGMVDNVLVSFGGASMDLGNGAIGGTINLENQTEWKNQTTVDVAAGTGSYGRNSGLVKISTGSARFQSNTKGYYNSSRNNFKYLDSEAIPAPLWKDRENNQLLQKGFMQEFYLRKSKNVLSARLWYQSSDRDLPGSTQYGYAGETQNDNSLRSIISYDFEKGKNEFFTTAALMMSNLDYKSALYAINSENKSSSLVLKAGMTSPLGDYSRLKIVLSNELNSVETNNYAESIKRNNASLTLSAERKKGRRMGAVVLLRQTIDDDKILIPDFSAGIEYRVFKGEEHYLKFNLSRNSKMPSLNDRYWNPGGNADLKNEYAYSFETGYKLDQLIFEKLALSTEINYFNNFIRDMIQWRPGDSWFWVADNIGRVNSSGLESSLSLKYAYNKVSVNLNSGYSYTIARPLSNDPAAIHGTQLVYVPKNQAFGSLTFAYKTIYTTWGTHYTGLTYTNADNSGSIPDYSINYLTSGMKFELRENYFDIRFKIDNILDKSYETIAFYPQPGRTYFLILSCHFKK